MAVLHKSDRTLRLRSSLDLVQTRLTGSSDPEACVTGELLDGAPFEVCDAVRTVPDMDGDALLDVG